MVFPMQNECNFFLHGIASVSMRIQCIQELIDLYVVAVYLYNPCFLKFLYRSGLFKDFMPGF